MVNYLDDKKFKRDLEIALKLDKLESEIRKERREKRINDLTFQEARAVAFKPITDLLKPIAEATKPKPKETKTMGNAVEIIKRALDDSRGEQNVYGVRNYEGKYLMNGVDLNFDNENVEVQGKNTS